MCTFFLRGMLMSIRRVVAFFCVAAFSVTAAYAAVNGQVADLSGRTVNVASLRLIKGSKIDVVCGGARMQVPFKQVSSMKIDPAQMSSVDGLMHYGVELRLSGGTVIGSIVEPGRCAVNADNGLRGKISKAPYSTPFNSVSSVRILGKGETAQGGDDEGEKE